MVTDAQTLPAAVEALAPRERATRRARWLCFLLLVHRIRFWHDALRRRLLALADVGAVVFAASVAAAVSGHHGLVLEALAFLPGWIVIAKVCGLYDRDHRSLRHLTTDELPRLVIWALAGAAAMSLFASPFHVRSLSDSDRLLLRVSLVVVAVLLRSAARAFWRASVPPERAVIIGSGALAAATRRKFELFPDMHVQIVKESLSTDWSPQALETFVEGADRVVLAARSVDEPLLATLVRVARRRQLKLSVVPPMRAEIGTAVELSHVADLPLVEYYTWDTSRSTLAAKRALDVVVSAVGLVVLAPLILALAVIVKLTSRGPAFFVQERAGLDGKPFTMVKFRTMVLGAQSRRPGLVSDLSHALAFKLRDDPRVTRVGKVLRRTSLDELPQLVNVLRGEMSLVGPRPEEIEVVEQYADEHRFRLTMKPGLTGPMQVYGRGALSFEERLAVERAYIEGFSLSGDFRILGMTITSVVRRRGAY